jgi:hypothetical protein
VKRKGEGGRGERVSEERRGRRSGGVQVMQRGQAIDQGKGDEEIQEDTYRRMGL